MKNLKWSSIVTALVYILGGLFMLLFPGRASDLACLILGVGLIVFGLLDIAKYFMLNVQDALIRNDFSAGIVWILIGILVMTHKDAVKEMVPFLLGIVMVASGINKVQDAIGIHRMAGQNAGLYMILALISVGLGIVFIVWSSESSDVLFQVMGAGLLYCGVTDLYLSLYISGRMKKFMKDKAPVDVRIDEAKKAEHDQNPETPQN
jgi:uncharacterized membrane protein HdeD (DUF308 family)